MFPLIPVVIVSGSALAFWKAKHKPKMTEQDKKIFEAAFKTLNSADDAEKLEKLAKAFEKKGFRAEAGELRKRAKIISLPPAKKKEYRDIAKKAMASTDPNKVKNVAQAFHAKGMYGTAKNLRDYALGLIKS